MTVSNWLTLCAAVVLGTLGALHVLYVFRGEKLLPRDPALRAAMEQATPVITRQTTMWRAHQGFSTSHGIGMVGLALVYGHLSVTRPHWPAALPFLAALGMLMLLTYLALARRYFFSIPLRAMALASLLYAVGWVLA